MLNELLTMTFVLLVPVWLVTERILTWLPPRLRTERVKVEKPLELRRPAREAVPAGRPARAA